MNKLQVILGVMVIGLSLLASTAEIPKPNYTRTMLKVARSLPGETEELKVRTSEGNVATLIVKRREKSGGDYRETGNSEESKAGNGILGKSENVSAAAAALSKEERKEAIRISEKEQIEEIREKTSRGNFSTDGKPEVSKNSIDRSDEGNSSSSPGITRTNTSVNDRKIDYGNWTPLGHDGRALVESIDDKDGKYSSWKPVGVGREIIANDRTNFARYSSLGSDRRESLVLGRNFQTRETKAGYEEDGVLRSRIVDNQPMPYAFLPQQSKPLTRTNIGANLSKNRGGKNVPPEVTVRSEINVKPLSKRTPMSMDADGTPIIHGTRVPDGPMDQFQTWRNARVINNKLITNNVDSQNGEASNGFGASENTAERQRFERFFKDVNRRYGRNFGEAERNVYFEWDPKTAHQNPALNAEVYETRNDNYRSNIQKRMLHPESYQVYPNSQVYTPESQKIAPLALKPGARAPVLQYAHPELGVQPAKILKNSEKRRPENFPDNQNSFTEQRHKKKYVLNEKTVVDSYAKNNYYPNQHFYGLKQPSDQPFWMKISENLRNQFSTGVERVSQLTRPVFDPLVEATQKISQNLGLSSSRGKEAEDKIGTVATGGGSILIPALGLVASGAALGIGAVAVGRYLDVDVLKRSRQLEADGEDVQLLEKNRALESIIDTEDRQKSGEAQDGGVFMILEEVEREAGNENGQTKALLDEGGHARTSRQRQRRSAPNEPGIPQFSDSGNSGNERFLSTTGSDSTTEIIETDASDILRKFASGQRNRRDAVDETDHELVDALQNLQNAEVLGAAHVDGDWTSTPCAKKLFCDTLIQRGPDALMFMEKRMNNLLRLIQPAAALQVSGHFQEVMEAVRRHDCSSFLCPQARPASVFF